MTANFIKINDFVEDVTEKVHDLQSDTLTIALSNTTPSLETLDPSADGNGVLANVTEIVYTNCSSRVLTVSSSAQTGGTYKIVVDDLTLTATGGSVGPFRYVYIYNDTATNDELIGYFDYSEALTLGDGESIQLDFNATDGLFTLA